MMQVVVSGFTAWGLQFQVAVSGFRVESVRGDVGYPLSAPSPLNPEPLTEQEYQAVEFIFGFI